MLAAQSGAAALLSLPPPARPQNMMMMPPSVRPGGLSVNGAGAVGYPVDLAPQEHRGPESHQQGPARPRESWLEGRLSPNGPQWPLKRLQHGDDGQAGDHMWPRAN